MSAEMVSRLVGQAVSGCRLLHTVAGVMRWTVAVMGDGSEGGWAMEEERWAD